MSHITKIKIDVRSLPALIKAAENLGLEFREGQKTHRWYGRFVGDYASTIDQKKMGLCDHALAIPGNSSAYEVGICATENGYDLHWDFWQGGYGLEALIGKEGSKLVSEYALEAAMEAAINQGWYCQRNADTVSIFHPDGGIITVNAEGAVDASQFTGADCVTACAPIEGALGVQSTRELKPEFYHRKQIITEQGE